MELGSLVQKKKTNNYTMLLNVYNRFPVEFVRGDGSYLYDIDDNRYLDFLCGIAVNGFGHNNKQIKSAVREQLDKFWHLSNLYESTPQKNLADKLTQVSGLDSVFFSNSGTEAVEAAIKFARKWGDGRYQIISAFGGFHGRSMGSLSATGQLKLHEGFTPMLKGFSFVPFGDIASIESKVNEQTVAVLVEPIQGEGGVNVPYKGYLKDLRNLCDEKDILLIVDEIQTGNGRTGKYFAYQHEEIIPDIVTTAKGLANGFPIGATICSSKIAEAISPGNHGSTFGGNPISIAAANKVVEMINEKVLENNAKLGTTLMDSLHGLHLEEIKEIRGKGLMIGIELKEGISSKKIASELLKEKVLVGTSGDTVIRILPPFIITQKEIMNFLLNFKKVILKVSEDNNHQKPE